MKREGERRLRWDEDTLNFSCNLSISSLTRLISWVWYSRIALRMWGRTNKALNREKMRNISAALRAVANWSRRREVIAVSTESMTSSYLCDMGIGGVISIGGTMSVGAVRRGDYRRYFRDFHTSSWLPSRCLHLPV